MGVYMEKIYVEYTWVYVNVFGIYMGLKDIPGVDAIVFGNT